MRKNSGDEGQRDSEGEEDRPVSSYNLICANEEAWWCWLLTLKHIQPFRVCVCVCLSPSYGSFFFFFFNKKSVLKTGDVLPIAWCSESEYVLYVLDMVAATVMKDVFIQLVNTAVLVLQTPFALGITEQYIMHAPFQLFPSSSSSLTSMKPVPSLLPSKTGCLKRHAFDVSFTHC